MTGGVIITNLVSRGRVLEVCWSQYTPWPERLGAVATSFRHKSDRVD